MTKKIAVIGLGSFGESLCGELMAQGAEVLAIDTNDAAVQRVAVNVSQAVIADTADEQVARELDLPSFYRVFVCIGDNLQASVLISLVLKEAGVKSLWVKSRNRLHRQILSKIGADVVINPERLMAERLARLIHSNRVCDYMDIGDSLSVYQLVLSQRQQGKSLASLALHGSINLLGFVHGDHIDTAPSPDKVLQAGDKLLIAGPITTLNKAIARI
jgi:trk system potassium uptake protein TrkA